MPASLQRVPVVLRARHKGLLVGRQPGPPSVRVTHVLAISFTRPAPARGCGRGRGFGAGDAGAPGSRGALSCGQGAPGTRGRPTRTASRGPAAAGAAAATCSPSDFFRAQSARPWGGMCSPAGAAPRLVSQSASLRKVKINHLREGLRRNLLEDLWSQLQSSISSC